MGKITYLPFAQVGKFPKLFLDYVNGKEFLTSFISAWALPENFAAQVELKKVTFTQQKRQILHQVLVRQYQQSGCTPPETVLQLLQPHSFTLTTGHQLNIFTGPLYFHYKIITTINAAKKLSQLYPQYRFIPVYWMASEDHDVDEINHFRLFGKKYTWQTDQKGAVGRFNPQSLAAVAQQAPEMHHALVQAYTHSNTLAEATRKIVDHFYRDEGIVILDGDDVELKRLFLPFVRKEITQQLSWKAVKSTTERLTALGYHCQVTPRQVNLFYLDHQFRQRIDIYHPEKKQYKVLNTNLFFTEEELLQWAEEYPEKISPNVVLRPLYQEVVLPNVCYIGGPAEIGYWLQFKEMFAAFETPMPLLLPRNSALLLEVRHQRKMQKLNLSVSDLFAPALKVRQKIVFQQENQYVTIGQEMESIIQQWDRVIAKVAEIRSHLKASRYSSKSVHAKKIITLCWKNSQSARTPP